MMKQLTLKEAVERGYDIHSLLGVDRETKQLIRNRRVDMTPVVESVANVEKNSDKIAYVTESTIDNVTPVVTKEEIKNSDFESFVAWCEKEFNRTPSMQDYRDAIEYYGTVALTAI